jgi:hypothetical protein
MTANNTINVSHTDAAQAFIEKVAALQQDIPNFIIPPSRKENNRLTSAASVPPEFIEMTLTATQNSTHLALGGTMDAAQVRDLINYAEAYAPAVAQLEALTQFLKHSVLAAKNKAGRQALTTYSLAQRLSKQPQAAYLAPIAEAMKNALGRKGRKAAAPAPQPSPTPTTPAKE